MKTIFTRFLIAIGCLGLVLPSLFGQAKTRSVVLPESAANQIKDLCSRPGPPKFDGPWTPTENDVQMMESHLSRISHLRSKSGFEGERVEHPERYYRQYVGIIIEKRKFIFINAFCDDTPPKYWRETVVDVCDGGCSWGVVYDIASREFSQLEMNGVG